jgi:hypothetical protein
MKRGFFILFGGLLTGLSSMTSFADDPWADTVVSYSAPNGVSGFTTASAALGAPIGLTESVPLNTVNTSPNVVSIGDTTGHLTLQFDTPVTDDPANSMGLDCIVFSNAFWIGGDENRKFQEPGVIEISQDGSNWFLIPGSRNLMYQAGNVPTIIEPAGGDNMGDPSLLGGAILNPNSSDGNPGNDGLEFNWGYADMAPVRAPYKDHYLRPDDPFAVGIGANSGGGDAFDIAWAIDNAGQPANLTDFSYIRFTTLVDRNMAVGVASSEIMAVADVPPNVDTDNDGLLDEFEINVIGTDPLRSENLVIYLNQPPYAGGNSPGNVLGTAVDSNNHSIILNANGPRASVTETTTMEISVPGSIPAGALPKMDYQPTTLIVDFSSTVTDFIAEELQAGFVSIKYMEADESGFNALTFEPFRFNGSGYDQIGISNIQVNRFNRSVSFRSQFSGTFLIGGVPGVTPLPAAPITTYVLWILFGVLLLWGAKKSHA